MKQPKVYTVVCYNPFKKIKTEQQRFTTEATILRQAEYTADKNPEYYVSITTNEDINYHYLIEPKQAEIDKQAIREGKMGYIDFIVKWALVHDQGIDIDPTPVAHRVTDKGVPCLPAQ